jgi:4-hydroxy-3-methylbut-2-enyl diphosphate reductase
MKMEVIISTYSGFCPGVREAEELLFREKEKWKQPLYVLGELIHNTNYLNYLEGKGIYTVKSLDEIQEGKKVVVRAHGISRQMETAIGSRHPFLDLTCDKIKEIQRLLKEYLLRDCFVVFTGKKAHPEIMGLVSYVKDFAVIEKENEIERFLKNWNRSYVKKYNRILILSQTTGNQRFFKNVSETIQSSLNGKCEIDVLNTICPVTTRREEEALKMQKEVEVIFVVGDKKSSNAAKLYERMKENGASCYFIEDREELEKLDLPLHSYRKALVVSSSSTPDFVEREITEYLENT